MQQPKTSPASSAGAPNNAGNTDSNWPFLVIAVLMAVVLWLFVRTGAQGPGQRAVWVPISVTNNSKHLTVSPGRIEVRVEGTSMLADRLTPEEVAVIADLAGHHPGDLVTLTVVPPQGFKVLGTSVNQVRVMGREPHPSAVPSEPHP